MTETSSSATLKRKQAKYADRRQRGLCGYGNCGASPAPGRSKCKKHLKVMSARAKEQRAVRIVEGMCVTCGLRPKFWGRKCLVCRQRATNDLFPKRALQAIRQFLDSEEARQQKTRDAALRASAKELLAPLNLGDRQQQALRLYLGLDGKDRRTYQQVGQLMQLSPERVRQLLLPSKRILGGKVGSAHTKSRVSQKRPTQGFQSECRHICAHCGRPFALLPL